MIVVSCSNEAEHTSSAFTGDYRYYAGISEFFDYETGKEDIFIEVEDYLMEEPPEESLLPSTVFIPNRLINFDTDRGCQKKNDS